MSVLEILASISLVALFRQFHLFPNGIRWVVNWVTHPPPWVLGTSCLPSPPPLPLPSVVCSRPSSHSEIRSLFDQNPPVIVVVGRLMAPKHPWPYAWSLCATSLGEKDPADVIKRMGLHGEGTLSHPSGFNSNPTSPPAGLRSEKWRCGPGRMLRGMSGEKDLTPSSWLCLEPHCPSSPCPPPPHTGLPPGYPGREIS